MHNCLDQYNFLHSSTSYCQSERPSSSEPKIEPMQVESTCLSPTERLCRVTQNICPYCGASGHLIAAHPIRPLRPMVSYSYYPSRLSLGQPITQSLEAFAGSYNSRKLQLKPCTRYSQRLEKSWAEVAFAMNL